ncbi:MAG: DNA translocase FtsK 4TM domain-containing protein, partial [Aquincola sp.]|nr:DNA translocase FtsK 4TM domain-containing protein [Aquincola sp.]
MTFPLGSLRTEPGAATTRGSARGAAAAASSSKAAASGGEGIANREVSLRLRLQLVLIVGGLLWLLGVLALVTHHPADPGFSTSGAGGPLHNKAGLLGAWASDCALYLFGH